MRVILLEDVKKQGKKDDIINVKDGYGMYLINNKLAVRETKTSSEVLKKEQDKAMLEEENLIKECETVKKQIENTTLKFKVKVGKNDQVFGQISSKQIAEELNKKNIKIDKKKIKIVTPINSLGTTNVEIILHKKVKANLKVLLEK